MQIGNAGYFFLGGEGNLWAPGSDVSLEQMPNAIEILGLDQNEKQGRLSSSSEEEVWVGGGKLEWCDSSNNCTIAESKFPTKPVEKPSISNSNEFSIQAFAERQQLMSDIFAAGRDERTRLFQHERLREAFGKYVSFWQVMLWLWSAKGDEDVHDTISVHRTEHMQERFLAPRSL